MRGSGKGGIRRGLGEGRTAAETGVGLCHTAKCPEQQLASWTREEGLEDERGGSKGADQKRYDVQDQERGGGRSEVGKQRVKVSGVGRED